MNTRYVGMESTVSKETILDIQNQSWYQNGGRVCLEQNYTDIRNITKTRKEEYIELNIKDFTLDPRIYGLDSYILIN